MDNKFNYQMLDRLQQDCKYAIYVGFTTQLWGVTTDSHIAEMRRLYKLVPVKPEWLSWQDINKYESSLLEIQTKVFFVGVDNWSRPVFKAVDCKEYYGSTDDLFSYGATEKEVLGHVTASDLLYFGRHFNCEPEGTKADVKIVPYVESCNKA